VGYESSFDTLTVGEMVIVVANIIIAITTGILVYTALPFLIITIIYLAKYKEENSKTSKNLKKIIFSYLIILSVSIILAVIKGVFEALVGY